MPQFAISDVLVEAVWFWAVIGACLARIDSCCLCHDTEKHPGLGDLATFFPACPQLGINLLDNWRDVYNRLVLLYVHGEDLGD